VSNASRGAARLPVAFDAAGPSTGVANIENQKAGPTVGPDAAAVDGDGLSARAERFCRAYVAGGNGAHAARRAGYAPGAARQQAHRLLGQAEVRRRVRQLQLRVAAEACDDARVLMAKLETVYRQAIQDRHYLAAVRAVEAQARLAGLPAEVDWDHGKEVGWDRQNHDG